MANILADFLVKDPKGFYCAYGDFYIDPVLPVHQAVVSHAHGDHATAGHANIRGTRHTLELMKARFGKKLTGSSCIPKEYHDRFELGGVDIEFISAGHMLGSAQIIMTYNGIRYLYTGDYKLQQDSTCAPIAYREADVLITETTFANPQVKHADPIEEIKKLKDRNFNIMLGCYAMGKAQSLTALINTYCPELEVHLHRNMVPYHRVYNTSDFTKLEYKEYTRQGFKQGVQNKVYLVPPMTFNNYFRATNVLRAFASGWDRLHQRNDISLYISDHVDWDDILFYIEKVKPKEIWTVHGDGRALKQYYEGQLLVRDICLRDEVLYNTP